MIMSCRATIAVGVVALVGALGGCGAGQQAQTSNQVAASGGAAGQVGTIAVRDAHIAFAGAVAGDTVFRPGEDAPLQVTIVNVATAATAGNSGGDRLTAVSSPIATASRIVGDTRIADGQVLTAGYDQQATSIEITLTGLTMPVHAGLTYPVVFTFAHAGQLRIELPVENPGAAPRGGS